MTLLRLVAWSLAFLINVALFLGMRMSPYLQYALHGEELPEPFVRHRIEFWPWPFSRELASTLTGQTERQVQAFFNDPYELPAPQGATRCIWFREDWDPFVTVLFRNGRAETVWVQPQEAPRTACPALVVRSYPFSLAIY